MNQANPKKWVVAGVIVVIVLALSLVSTIYDLLQPDPPPTEPTLHTEPLPTQTEPTETEPTEPIPTETEPMETEPTIPPTEEPFDPDATYVDWIMSCHRIAADGTRIETFPLTLKGKIKDVENKEEMVNLFLEMDFPIGFRYRYVQSDTGDFGYKGTIIAEGDPNVIFGITHTYDSVENRATVCYYCIDPELGYFLAYWLDGDGSYLASSTDSAVTAQDILEYFRPYIENWGIEIP